MVGQSHQDPDAGSGCAWYRASITNLRWHGMAQHPSADQSGHGPSLNDDDVRAWQEFIAPGQPDQKKAEPPELSAEDQAEWNSFLADSNPASDIPKEVDVTDHPSAKPKTEAPVRRQPERPGSLTRADLRRLRAGKWDPEAHLDLHGRVQDEADRLLAGFLIGQQRNGARLVLIIPGKGLHSTDRSADSMGVLNRRVVQLLSTGDLASLVTFFEHAHGTHGGKGAYYVILKQRQRRH